MNTFRKILFVSIILLTGINLVSCTTTKHLNNYITLKVENIQNITYTLNDDELFNSDDLTVQEKSDIFSRVYNKLMKYEIDDSTIDFAEDGCDTGTIPVIMITANNTRIKLQTFCLVDDNHPHGYTATVIYIEDIGIVGRSEGPLFSDLEDIFGV